MDFLRAESIEALMSSRNIAHVVAQPGHHKHISSRTVLQSALVCNVGVF